LPRKIILSECLIILSAIIIFSSSCSSEKGEGPGFFRGLIDKINPFDEKDPDPEEDMQSDLEDTMLFDMNPDEVDSYLRHLHASERNFLRRIEIIGRKSIGQPHRQEVTGEFPFEIPADRPMVNLDESDCMTFVENTLAMALADDWRKFFIFLQRIRYRDGILSWENRNHFFEADWEESNRWLVEDINEKIGKGLLIRYEFEPERDSLFESNGRKNPFPYRNVSFKYFPPENVPKILHHLKSGYVFNVIRSNLSERIWVGHLGLILVDHGTVLILHSAIPEVYTMTIEEYIRDQLDKKPERVRENKSFFVGFRFFAPRKDAAARLKKIDGPGYPKLTVYGQSSATRHTHR
jgi:hypothetical protein